MPAHPACLHALRRHGSSCRPPLFLFAGIPDAPSALNATPKHDSSAVDLSFVPAWLAEQGYKIELLDKDGSFLAKLTVPADTCTVKAAAPQ